MYFPYFSVKEEEALRNYVVWHGLWVWSNLGLPDSNSRLKFSLNIYNIENKDIPPKPKKGEELNLDLLQAKNLESMTPKRPWPSEQSPGAPRAWKVQCFFVEHWKCIWGVFCPQTTGIPPAGTTAESSCFRLLPRPEQGKASGGGNAENAGGLSLFP